MIILELKTNIKCNGCIAAIKPGLDATEGLTRWEVDLTDPDRKLTAEVDSEEVKENLIKTLEKAGYKAW
ncbi:heavy metal-associated domain-containing protein [Lentimicrobium sp.]|uniref:heavy-metal-associated domain-containing protein n=1 Tax=Lentimicrobium sp. TaxID=2034841 RepID=UPI002CB6AEE7|nr:heavy metal-associated domain-containing protein [Lentimicrobium sp.]HPJ61460.1 heavy metal-associated domain-containing protein [Lentimicrobium sp.]